MKTTIGERLQKLRKKMGLTQEDIAEKVNVSAQAVSKWENDISVPDITILPELADLFHISLDELLGREIPKTEILSLERRKDIHNMILKIIMDSKNGDKVRVNIPVAIIQVCLESGLALPEINGTTILNKIDFNKIFLLIEQGVIGELVVVESAEDGITLRIVVE